ncbi:unnamed protein product, partial [Ectocarpus fasciculatus]
MKFVLDVEGMMCQNSCGATVENALKAVPGVTGVIVSFPLHTATVLGDPELQEQDLIEAVEAVGFDAVPLSTLPPDVRLRVTGMMCQKSCGTTVETALGSVPGVILAVAEFGRSEARVWGTASVVDLMDAVDIVGFEAELLEGGASAGQKDEKPDLIIFVEDNEAGAPAQGLRGGCPEAAHIQGISSAACVKSIESALVGRSGIRDVKCALLTGQTLISFDPKVTGDTADGKITTAIVKDVLSSIGYSCDILNVRAAGSGGQTGDDGDANKIVLSISGMSCANCAAKVERSLDKHPAVASAAVSVMTNKAAVCLDELVAMSDDAIGVRDLIKIVEDLGYGCKLVSVGSKQAGSSEDTESSGSEDVREWQRLLEIALLFGIPLVVLHLGMNVSEDLDMALMGPAACGGGITVGQVIMLLLNTPIMVLVGWRFFRGAAMGARHGSFGMDFLISTGTSITYFYSILQLGLACNAGEPTHHVFLEVSGMLLLFVTIGKFIEAYARRHTASAILSLLKMQPTTDTIGTGVEVVTEIDVQLLQKGDVLKVMPGSRLPADGIILSGSTYIDESMLTGESVPVLKQKGDNVFGSTVNQGGSAMGAGGSSASRSSNTVYIQASSVGAESALSQIVRLVEEAQMNRAPIQAFADKLASIFTPVVLSLAVLTFVVWYSCSLAGVVPKEWFESQYDDPFLFSLLFAISVVVISCPCALGLATPTAIMVGTSVGAQNGVLIKGGGAFEIAHSVSAVIFDKTGTLTVGKPFVTDEVVLQPAALPGSTCKPLDGVSQDDRLLYLAACAEQQNTHPIAFAIVQEAKSRELTLPWLSDDLLSSGRGVACDVQDIGCIQVGNRKFMETNGIVLDTKTDAALWDLEFKGKTAVCVALNQLIVGVLGVADTTKPDAAPAISALRAMGVDVWMVTGDNRTTAESIALQLEIPKDRIVASAMPGDKVTKVKELQDQGFIVAVVGDGINDSPALALSNLGIAVGAGSHVATEAADMILVRDKLVDVVMALHLAKVVFNRIKLNFLWASAYNVLAIPFAAGLWYPWFQYSLPPQYAALAMALSSVSVVASSSLLKCYKRPDILTVETE